MDYKKYALEQLENWIHDCITSGEASPSEIYSTIRKAVQENYEIHKEISQRCFGLLELMSGHRPVSFNSDKIEFTKQDVLKERQYYEPWGNNDMESIIHPHGNDMITFDNCNYSDYSSWESFYYPEEYSNSTQYTEEELNAMCDYAEKQEKEKSKKWTLPVEVDGASGEYYLQLPDDLLDILKWKEGDTLEYNDNGDGSFSVRKVSKILRMDEC